MESYIFTSSLQEFLRAKRIIVWVFLSIALFGIATVYHRIDPNSSRQDAYVLLSATLVYRILPLAAAIFSTAIIAQEVEQRTIVYLLTRPVARWKLVLFKTLAATVVVFGIAALSAVAVSLGSYGASNPLLLRDITALAVGAFAYTSLFTFVSLLLNRSMIVSLLFAFAWETSVPNMPGDLYRLTIGSYLTTISHRPSTGGPKSIMDALSGMFGVNTISDSTAWMGMIGLTAVCLAASCYWFSHFEYAAREDAE